MDFHHKLEYEQGLSAETAQRLQREGVLFAQQVENARPEHHRVRDELEAAIQNARLSAVNETQQLNASIAHVQTESQNLAREALETHVLQQRLATEQQERQIHEQLCTQGINLLEHVAHEHEAPLSATVRQRDSAEQQLTQLRASSARRCACN